MHGAVLLEIFVLLSAVGVAFNLLVYRRRRRLVAKEGWLESMPLLGESNRLLMISPIVFAALAAAAVFLLHVGSEVAHYPEALVLVFGLGHAIAWADAGMNFRFLGKMERCYTASEKVPDT